MVRTQFTELKQSENESDLTSRNEFYFSESLRKKLRESRIAFAGCGLGSNIALLSVRSGFKKFILADGDKVDVSNLNRQIFSLGDVGKNKAAASAEIIQKIEPEAECDIITKFININDVKGIIDRCNIIINTIDYGETFIELIERATARNKLVVVPFNVAYGVVIYCFTKRSKSIKEILAPYTVNNNIDLYKALAQINKTRLPAYLSKRLIKLFKFIQKKKYSPQLGIASLLNSSIILTCIINWLSNKKIPVSPTPIYIDIQKSISKDGKS